MPGQADDFSGKQWEFLAALKALDQPVHIDLLGELVPLPPGPFVDLIRRSRDLGWLKMTAPDTYALSGSLPVSVENRLDELNSPARLGKLLRRFQQGGHSGQVTNQTLSRLYQMSGQETESALVQRDLADKALQDGELEQALFHAESLVAGLSGKDIHENSRGVFVSGALLLSKLRLRLGKRVGEVPGLLKRARREAAAMGDRRSQALASLHLGRFSYVSDNLSDALASLVTGLDEVDELGDEDIKAESSQFMGLYFFLQGLHKDAVKHFDRALMAPQSRGDDLDRFFPPYTFGYCAAYLGQFHRSVGILDYNWRRYRDDAPSLAAYFCSALGIVLLMMGRKQRAEATLREAEEISRIHLNRASLLLANVGMAHFHFLSGDVHTAARVMSESTAEAGKADYQVRNYIFPFILEHVYEYERLGLDCLPEHYHYRNQVKTLVNGPNIHLRGVALRLRARQAFERKENTETIRADLDASLRYLRRSGDPIEQAKTKAQMARLEQHAGDREKAAQLAGEAWDHLAIYDGAFFPRELAELLTEGGSAPRGQVSQREIVDRFLDLLQELVPSADLDELLTRIVAVATRFYRAERGGLFWFQGDQSKQAPVLRSACNLSVREVETEAFRSRLSLVFQAYKSNLPLVAKSPGPGGGAVLCLPFEVRGRVSGVLYHDNSYTYEGFDFLDQEMLFKVARHLSTYIERIWDYCRLAEEKGRLYSGQSARAGQAGSEKLVGNSPILKQLLSRADQVADSEASVLILGETGVGKELVAKRLHGLSSRSEGPFIAMDLSAIPEGLVESELFGHEKGAFTGAHRQKPGRLELAHLGTLFIDEIGEIPLIIQVKLLRILQDKSFTRIGGTKTLSSDFRLIAATNRDLKEEVAAGRFREDLFYRLNVIPLKMPPLRERGRDMVLLAKYFIRQYARKHNRPPLELTPENEAELTRYPWPGNVRELKNVIERAVLLAADGHLDLNLSAGQIPSSSPFSDTPTMAELQRRYIRFVLEKTGGRKGGPNGAAAILGMKRSTLYTRMAKLGL